MKTVKLEKWLLLEQSGELSPRQLRRLGRELSASEQARIFRKELGRLRGSIIIPDAEPSPWTIGRIAARLREEHRPTAGFYKVLKPALALSVCLAVVNGIVNFHGKQTPSTSTAVVMAAAEVDVWNDPFEEDLSKLENLIVAMSGNPLSIMEM